MELEEVMPDGKLKEIIDEALGKKEVSSHPVCFNCSGYCCQIFSLPMTKTRIRKEIKNGLASETRKKDYLKIIKYFKRLDHIVDEHGTSFYTCRKFNKVNHKCDVYDKRPDCCRFFLCSPAKIEKRVPSKNEMYAGQLN